MYFYNLLVFVLILKIAFLRAQQIQLKKSGCRQEVPDIMLPVDIFPRILQFLTLQDVGKGLSVSKGWNIACRNDTTWRVCEHSTKDSTDYLKGTFPKKISEN